jgi:ERCC4-type nuclease
MNVLPLADKSEMVFALPPSGRLLVRREGRSIAKLVPKPVVIVDSREQAPFEFKGLDNWIGGTTKRCLDAGDYSVIGMERLIRLERKSLGDLITTLMQWRGRFFDRCALLARFRYAAILVEATYEDVKSYYNADLCTQAHPNAVSGSLDALEARFGIPVIYTSQHRALAEEKAASWLSKHFTYWYLEKQGMGRVLQPGDL